MADDTTPTPGELQVPGDAGGPAELNGGSWPAPATPAEPVWAQPAPLAFGQDPARSDKNWLGVVSIVLAFIGAGVIGVVFGVLGLKAAKRGQATNRALALAGTILSVVVTVVVVIGLGAVILLANHAAAHPTKSGLAIGDCIEKPGGWEDEGGGDLNEKFSLVNCEGDHWAEVLAKPKLSGDAYPGDAAVNQQAEDACFAQENIDKIADAHLDEAALAGVFPSDETWADGDRTVVCLLVGSGDVITGEWLKP